MIERCERKYLMQVPEKGAAYEQACITRGEVHLVCRWVCGDPAMFRRGNDNKYRHIRPLTRAPLTIFVGWVDDLVQ